MALIKQTQIKSKWFWANSSCTTRIAVIREQTPVIGGQVFYTLIITSVAYNGKSSGEDCIASEVKIRILIFEIRDPDLKIYPASMQMLIWKPPGAMLFHV